MQVAERRSKARKKAKPSRSRGVVSDEDPMEASTLSHSDLVGLRAPSAFLRLQSDEKLVTLTRRGNQAAYEALVGRYHARILGFTKHMLASKEDAEDVTQEAFSAAYSAMMADQREINVKPWLYRIARNRSLNHLRRQSAVGVDDFDHHVAHHGRTTEDEAHQREDLRQLMSDVRELPESQRTALLLREIDALSYEQIAEAMETTVPSVKSLLVRARGGLAEAAEARLISCEEARQEMTEAAEGLTKISAPVRRHTRDCDRCTGYRAALKQNNKALALLLPIGPILLIKKLIIAHIGSSVGAGGAAASTASSGMLSGAIGSVAVKTAATVAAAALVTAGAVEVKQATTASPLRQSASAVISPTVVASAAVAPRTESLAAAKAAARKKASAVKPAAIVQPTIEPTSPAVVVVSPVTPPVAETPTVTPPAAPPVIVEEHHGEVVLEQTTEPVDPTPPVDPEPPVKPQSEDDAATYPAP